MNRNVLPKFASVLTAVSVVAAVLPVHAEDLEQLNQLLRTRECQSCNLSGASFVYTNLRQVDLNNADLSLANLNRADLQQANLRSANLSGAVLYNANLTGADLSGADLRGADLREAYLTGVNLTGATLDGANLRGAIGIPDHVISPEEYYRWALFEADRGNYRGAIGYYNQSLTLKPDLAQAYLGRSISRYRLGDVEGALDDAKQAEEIFTRQGNTNGQQTAVTLHDGIVQAEEAAAQSARGGGGGSNFLNFLGSLGTLLLRLAL